MPAGKLLAIYMIGSDLEDGKGRPENGLAGTKDFKELIEGYKSLPEDHGVKVIVAFGGANKDGWRGMKFADMDQIMDDSEDGEFGNETRADAYLYRDDSANMGDESSLFEFLAYLSVGHSGFERSFLTFWDHGASYKGFGPDTNSDDDMLHDMLHMDEITRAFQRSQPGVFDLIGFDACYMASVEVAKVIEPYADYMIASEELEPGHGWLWSEVVRIYALEDDITEAGRQMVDNFVQDVHGSDAREKTLSLLDLSQYYQLVAALDPVLSTFSDHMLSNSDYSDSLIYSSTEAQEYARSEREGTRLSLDLKHFAQLLMEKLPDSNARSDLEDLIAAVDRFVVHSNHDGSRPNSFGIAIAAPENTTPEYSDYKVSDAWLDFQDTYAQLRQTDTAPPVIVDHLIYPDGADVTIQDDNLASVTVLYGFIEQVLVEDGSVEDYFMTVAELETYPTGNENEYYAPAWNQWWFTVEYDPNELTAWIPASFVERFEKGGQEYTVYASEIDYYRAGEPESELAVMTLYVNEYMEVVYHEIQTYWEDEQGSVWFDKASYWISPGDALQFWNFGFNLADESKDGWFEAGDIITFVQDPVFYPELLPSEDEFGQPVEYYYGIWAEDISGNAVLDGPYAVEQ